MKKTLYDVLPKRKRIYQTAYHRMAHYIYPDGAESLIKVQHKAPKTLRDKLAYNMIRTIRHFYDFATRYNREHMTQAKWIQRCILLQTVAGVPGMVGGMCRHLKSLRDLQRDKGWIHTLLEQADNERFHLFIFLDIKKPSFLERCFILIMQGTFMNMFFISYLLSSKFSHRFVGYLQEEAVKTYTVMLQEMEKPDSVLKAWTVMRPPNQVRAYYQLYEDATYQDVIKCIRADEAVHRAANHYLAEVDQKVQIVEQQIHVINNKKDEKDSKEGGGGDIMK